MLNALKNRSEASEAEKFGMNKRGEPVPLQSIPPPVPRPEAAQLQSPSILLLPWKDEVIGDEHDSGVCEQSESGPNNAIGEESTQRSPITDNVGKNLNLNSDSLERVGSFEIVRNFGEYGKNVITRDVHVKESRPEEIIDGKRVKRVLRKQGAPVKFVREKAPSLMKEDDDIMIVSSTASRRRTRLIVAALEKKNVAFGLGGDPNESMEPTTTVDLKELERKAEERKRSRKGKRASDVKESGILAKGDKFVIDDVAESGEEVDIQKLKLRAKGKLRVNESRYRINNRRIVKDVEEISTNGVDFCGEEHEARWKFVSVRNILPERHLSEVTYNNQAYIDILQEGGLLGIMSDIGPHWPKLVREFICNLSEEITDPASPMFHKDAVCNGGKMLNAEKIIFYQIVDHVETGAKLKPIGFRSLICSLLITQYPNVLKKVDGLGEDAKPLTISDKLMKEKHAIDVEFNAVDQPEPVPEGEAAGMFLTGYEEELPRVEAEIRAKTVLASELKAKIHALKLRVPPVVNASANPVSVAPTSANPPNDAETTVVVPGATGDETFTSHV
ncbi:hypothetical protein LIER_08564 [Lithospermum erythrorhizon]|uniref:Uncharacterized protein n=1 Tax=Lithospermum erythrorhizon TaxID=34254 RepID=A0AAV3PDM2_LITER